MGNKIKPILTSKRIEWLTKLRDTGPSTRKTVAGYHCMKLNWTSWVYDRNGELVTGSDLKEKYNDQISMPEIIQKEGLKPTHLEMITADGLAALKAAGI